MPSYNAAQTLRKTCDEVVAKAWSTGLLFRLFRTAFSNPTGSLLLKSSMPENQRPPGLGGLHSSKSRNL
jgi:hypothetical protein